MDEKTRMQQAERDAAYFRAKEEQRTKDAEAALFKSEYNLRLNLQMSYNL